MLVAPSSPGETSLANILTTTSPVFMLIGLGYFAVRSGLLPRESTRLLGIFVLYFALPALLFKALSERDFSEILFNLTYLLGYGLGSLAVFGAMLFIGGRFRGRGLVNGSILALGSSLSNSGFIGYPILLPLLGPSAMVPFALTL